MVLQVLAYFINFVTNVIMRAGFISTDDGQKKRSKIPQQLQKNKNHEITNNKLSYSKTLIKKLKLLC